MKKDIVIINSNIELIGALELLFQDEGYSTASYQVLDFKTGNINIRKILKREDPQVILYDISIPYKENWEFFKKIKETKEARGINFILTTTNKRALESFVGEVQAIEIIGKPFDVEEIIRVAREQMAKSQKEKEILT